MKLSDFIDIDSKFYWKFLTVLKNSVNPKKKLFEYFKKMPKIPSMKKILIISSFVLVLSLIDFTAGSPYPSIGKGKTKRLGKFFFQKLFILFVPVLLWFTVHKLLSFVHIVWR